MAKEAKGDKEKGGKSKIIIIIIIAVAAVALVGVKLFVLGGSKKAAAAGAAATPTPSPSPGDVLPVGDMTVNLADQGHYAAVTLALELTTTAKSAEVTKQLPLLQDAALKKLAPGGQDQVRADLTAAAQSLFGKDQVMAVLLTQLVVQ
jgi:flagellar basal body-associated protein FliL